MARACSVVLSAVFLSGCLPTYDNHYALATGDTDAGVDASTSNPCIESSGAEISGAPFVMDKMNSANGPAPSSGPAIKESSS